MENKDTVCADDRTAGPLNAPLSLPGQFIKKMMKEECGVSTDPKGFVFGLCCHRGLDTHVRILRDTNMYRKRTP